MALYVALILYMMVTVNSDVYLHPSSSDLFSENCISGYGHTTLYTMSSGLNSKEVIRPQVPLRPPCYDFSLVADLRFDNAKSHHLA